MTEYNLHFSTVFSAMAQKVNAGHQGMNICENETDSGYKQYS